MRLGGPNSISRGTRGPRRVAADSPCLAVFAPLSSVSSVASAMTVRLSGFPGRLAIGKAACWDRRRSMAAMIPGRRDACWWPGAASIAPRRSVMSPSSILSRPCSSRWTTDCAPRSPTRNASSSFVVTNAAVIPICEGAHQNVPIIQQEADRKLRSRRTVPIALYSSHRHRSLAISAT
jgi:hypothetical protein